jgi:hypothetical protein
MSDQEPLRPADLAVLILASGDLSPRQRARDQQADLGGNELKRRMLNELVLADPEPEALEVMLEAIVQALGEPTGPTRAIALSILDDWQAARESPAFVEWLLAQAVEEGQEPREGRRRGRKNRQPAETTDTGST